MTGNPFGKGSLYHLLINLASQLSDRSKRRQNGTLFGLGLTMLFVALLFLKPYPIEKLDHMLYDASFHLRGSLPNPGTVVIAAIDEKSIDRLGRWPWGRDVLARLVDQLARHEANLIVFDILLSEPERNDILLARAMERQGTVLLPIMFELNSSSSKRPSEELLRSAYMNYGNAEQLSKVALIRSDHVVAPVPQLAREAFAVGHINMFPDEDGTLRSEALIIASGGFLFPSLDVQAVAAYQGIPMEGIVLRAANDIQMGKLQIMSDPVGRMLINYYGPDQTFEYISIADILDGKVDPQLIRGKIVLVGAAAAGLYDLRVTPFSKVMPGVEKHANVIASLIDGRLLRAASSIENVLFILALGCGFALFIPRFTAVIGAGVVLVSFAGLGTVGFILFVNKGIWISQAYPALMLAVNFTMVTIYNYALEEKYARRIRTMFSSYVTERVVKELIRNPQMAKLGGERREVTILFSDIQGFTSFSEKHSPEEVVALLNEYLTAMAEVIFRWEGTLDKFIGDAIVVFWGAPLKQEDHAELAIRCALHMQRRLHELQKKWTADGKPVLDAGIGLNTGQVLVGNIGAEGKKMDYTVIGDHVNLCSRIEGLTRQCAAGILISEHTFRKIESLARSRILGHLSVRGIDRVVLKGKAEPVGIYAVAELEEGQPTAIDDALPESSRICDSK